MWAQQEQKWNLECEARERLMTEVLVILQRQLEEKLEANLAEQRELVRSREALVARVEQANAELQEERAAIDRMKEACRKDLDIQVLGVKGDCRFLSPFFFFFFFFGFFFFFFVFVVFFFFFFFGACLLLSC